MRKGLFNGDTMARSKITSQGIQLQEDTGAVLFSIVEGEQLEFELTLSFLTSIKDYTFECVLIEADNTGNGKIPKIVKPSGEETSITVYVPPDQGVWSASDPYSYRDLVTYNDTFYIKSSGVLNEISSTTPDIDTSWTKYINNKIYLRFTEDLITTWSILPFPDKPVYGFIDLRVTEPNTGIGFRQTWKPVQGLVEFNFSPTERVS
jgi:hypothetical protein